jgi:hypothetical protein
VIIAKFGSPKLTQIHPNNQIQFFGSPKCTQINKFGSLGHLNNHLWVTQTHPNAPKFSNKVNLELIRKCFYATMTIASLDQCNVVLDGHAIPDTLLNPNIAQTLSQNIRG